MVALGAAMPVADARMAWRRSKPADLQYGMMAAAMDNEGIMGTSVSGQAGEARGCLYTIGHSNHPLDTFLGLLDAHAIQVLVDVRSQPYSKYTPHFASRQLKAAVTAREILYLYLGKELGGRPNGAEFYDADGYVRYDLVAESPLFLEGIARLEQGIGKYRVAAMCAEEDPAGCHRRLLIGRVLGARGTTVLHIRADGSLQPEEEFGATDAPRHASGQLTLFPDVEMREWKSTRSVLRKEPPRTSSER
jgi:uncharacterized protein (DUF488 family)